MTGPTQFAESNALLAVVREDLDEARRIIDTMLPGERRQLAKQAHKLAYLLGERDRVDEALGGLCRWGQYCWQDSDAYILVRGKPRGICQRHRATALEDGYMVHERPAEVKL